MLDHTRWNGATRAGDRLSPKAAPPASIHSGGHHAEIPIEAAHHRTQIPHGSAESVRSAILTFLSAVVQNRIVRSHDKEVLSVDTGRAEQ